MYREKKVSPKTEPWSLLMFTGQEGEKEPAKENTGQTGEDTENKLTLQGVKGGEGVNHVFNLLSTRTI